MSKKQQQPQSDAKWTCRRKFKNFTRTFYLFCLVLFAHVLAVTFSKRPGSRLLDGSEATALTFNIRLIDVCVPLPGPSGPAGDRGEEMDGPSGLTERAPGLGTRQAPLASSLANRCLSHGQQAIDALARAQAEGRRCRSERIYFSSFSAQHVAQNWLVVG